MNHIVAKINAAIGNHADLQALAKSLHGIAETILIRNESDECFPAIIDPNGECQDVLFDDANAVSLYHRLNAKTYTTVRVSGFGDDPQRICVCDMSMVVSGKRNAIDPYRMEEICTAAIERSVKGERKYNTEVNTVNFNRLQVFSQEYTNMLFPMDTDIFLFKINYKIIRVQSPC